MPRFHKFIYHGIIRPTRLRAEATIINALPGKTLLEIGYFDDSFKKLARKDLLYAGIDPAPTVPIPGMPITDVEHYHPAKQFDIVVASNILEHTSDPVIAFKQIKKLAKKYIVISVPYEPWYTLTRFFVPEPEHYWTIHPTILEHYFGKPVSEHWLHLWRTYVAVYAVK
jgi:SAM-dependent methyltransferase